MLRLIIPILIFSAIELYAFKGIRSVSIGLDPMWRKIVLWLYWIIALVAYGGIVFLMVKWSQRGDSNDVRSYGLFNFVVGFFIISVTTKLLFGSFHLLNDITSFIERALAQADRKAGE